MKDEEIINKTFPQNCRDNLFVLKKLKEKDSGGHYLFLCQFQKYFCEVKANKRHILERCVNNPQIEQVEFINKIWPQNCGDSLRIIEKTNKKEKGIALFECEFIKYPFKIFASKGNILKGKVNNPQIEQVEFINKLWPQNCGDTLKVIKKSNVNRGGYLWEAEFIKYPYKVLRTKKEIITGIVLNPLFEKNEFIGHVFPQKCGDNLLVLKKEEDYYLCEFQICKGETLKIKEKTRVEKGEISNPYVIWKNKDKLSNFIQKRFNNKKPTLQELQNELKDLKGNAFSVSFIGAIINKFGLRDKINYAPSSKGEIEIKEYIEGLKIKSENNWTILEGKEIDIYIPDFNFGIEYNGNYWHSEAIKDNNYHQNKSLAARKKNIFILHIFEYEWNEKQNILKSLIELKLGIINKKIGASKCKIKGVSNKEYQDFCEENHLQGSCGARIKLGLFYKEELVQIMSFGSPRFTNDYEWEIIRECSKLKYIIIGGKEKLWSYFIKNYSPNSVISYCNFSKFDGHSYLKLGFKFKRLNKPGFVWFDNITKNVYWRNPYKHQEMKEKYLKIYDCGQLVFTWGKEN